VTVAAAVSHSGSEVTAPDKLQATSLAANDFALFQLPQQYAINLLALEQSWKALQRHAHPDMHAQGDASAQRLSMQWSVRINEAYQRLKNPIKRAAYLCELQGVPISAETNTAMPTDFLVQQITWREALDTAASPAEMDGLLTEVKAYRDSLLAECERFLDVVCDAHKAAMSVRALMFVDRFIQAVVLQLDRLESA
jgi:molecular chaperone HscB